MNKRQYTESKMAHEGRGNYPFNYLKESDPNTLSNHYYLL